MKVKGRHLLSVRSYSISLLKFLQQGSILGPCLSFDYNNNPPKKIVAIVLISRILKLGLVLGIILIIHLLSWQFRHCICISILGIFD